LLVFKIALQVIAALFVLVDQIRSKEKFKNILLWMAIIFMIGTAFLTWYDHIITSSSDRERKADLMLIEKLQSSFKNLCFEFELVDVDSSSMIGIQFQLATSVNTMLSGTGQFADYIQIGYSADSGWFFINSTFKRYEDILFDIDAKKRKVRVTFKNFAVSAKQGTSLVGWQPNNIADLGHLHLNLSAFPLDDKDYLWSYDDKWCPIGKINIFVNTFDHENLLAVAERIPRSPEAKRLAWHTFMPKWKTHFSNVMEDDFALEPIRLRESIISSLD